MAGCVFQILFYLGFVEAQLRRISETFAWLENVLLKELPTAD